MFRILRAFAWMRWRMMLNSFESTGSRDMLERFSIAIEKLGPIIALVLIVPSALILLAGSTAAGYAVAVDNPYSVIFLALRWMLIFVPIAAAIGPLFLPSGDRTNPVRLLLLPIPRSTIYVAQAAGTLGEPWIVLMLPILAGLPIGLLAGGAYAASAFAVVAGLLLLSVTVGIAALSSTILHLIVRDRRRAELFGLIFVLIISMAGLLPGLLDTPRNKTPDGRIRRDTATAAAVEAYGRRAAALYPTELYIRGTRAAARGSLAGSGGAVLALFGISTLIHAVGFFAFGRVLDGPTASAGRRLTAEHRGWRRLPGLSPGASAVAMAHLRLVTRTTRGRTSLMSPLLMLVIFSALAFQWQGAMDFGSFQLHGGLPLATFISFIALVSMLPIAMNQFAVDRAGLTMVLLSPLPEEDYLAGKAFGIAMTSLPMSFFAIVAVFVMFPGGAPALWLCIPLGITATYLLVAPAAAIFSAMLPKLADLSSIGGKGNAHGLAGLLGLLSFVAGAAPPVVLVLIATALVDRPWLAPVLVAAWCAVAYGFSRFLFVVARRIFLSRRENLATLVSRLVLPS